MRLPRLIRSMTLLVALIACAPSLDAQQKPAPTADVAELWQDPVDLKSRDLFHGPGGADLAPPQTGGKFQFVAIKTTGSNPGFQVKDGKGRLWNVKIGIEAQPEVTASRIMWALGFAQPPTYFVYEFTMTGGGGQSIIKNSRFRTEIGPGRPTADWSWYDNPFLNTREFHGLVAAQLILNNWDLKTVNNKVYEAAAGAAGPRRHYMVRDLGASLGYSKQFPLFTLLGTPGGQGSKNDIDGFESQDFIKGVDGGRIIFDYRGMHYDLLQRVSVPDVIWICELFARISDQQWQDAFKAGAYSPQEADRYIRKIKQKVSEGLALKTATP